MSDCGSWFWTGFYATLGYAGASLLILAWLACGVVIGLGVAKWKKWI
jgi:hypothetical protein